MWSGSRHVAEACSLQGGAAVRQALALLAAGCVCVRVRMLLCGVCAEGIVGVGALETYLVK